MFTGFSGAKSRTSLGRAVVALLAVATAITVLPGAAASVDTGYANPITTEFVCARHPVAGNATCLAERRTDIPVRRQAEITAAATPSGYSPANLKSAYNIPSGPVSTTVPTVAIVDAYDDPDVVSDVATYRSTFNLQTCVTSTGSGCVTKVNETGGTTLPSKDKGWSSEIALDAEMVSAACPVCKILLVEANSSSFSDLETAAQYAASKVGVGGAVSNSYGGSESSSETGYDSYYKPPAGVAMVASSGDEGYESQNNRGNSVYQIEYPAASQYVVAVGGTSLKPATGTARGWTESVWWTSDSEAATSGCSAYEKKPSWQQDSGCQMRTVADVSAVADPATGVAVLDSYGSGGWTVFGGTSVASPLIATLYAMSGRTSASPSPASTLYPTTTGGPIVLGLNDVTQGYNYSKCPTTNAYLCTAEVGYDGPTGNGTPWGLAALGGTSSTSSSAPFTISAGSNPSPLTVAPGGNATITATMGVVSGSQSENVTVNFTGLPSGVTAPQTSFSSVNTSGGTATLQLNVGSTVSYGTYPIQITATDANTPANTASTTVTLTVPNPCNNAQQLANAGFESGNTNWTSTPQVIGEWTGAEAPHSGSWDGWMDGYTSKHTDSLSQTIAVPGAACKTATLTFWVKMITTQTKTATDTFTANLGGQTLVLNNTSPITAWTQEQVTYSLTGQTSVPVTLTGVQAGSATTSFVVDDTSLTFS